MMNRTNAASPSTMRNLRNLLRRPVAGALALGLMGTLWAPGVEAAEPRTDGFLYGRVVTEGGSEFVGRLRWGSEESFWGDFFNSSKEDRGLPRKMPRRAEKSRSRSRSRRETIKVFGIPVGVRWENGSSTRAFKVRFGDIKLIEPTSGDGAIVTMRDGVEVEVDGGSNDVGATITVWDGSLGEAEIDWDDIREIEFMKAPRDLDTDAFRLYGTVETSDGTFSGFIQWDQDEGLSTDKLDGDTRDAEVSIAMGRIATIERRSRRSSRVVLLDGRELVLDDSNDVDDGNRGIFIEDDSFGRVLVTWTAFRKVDFKKPKDSGPAFEKFGKSSALRGTVITRDGDRLRGRIFFDLDEAHGWEILDGNRRDLEYSILFDRIASIERDGPDASLIELRDGRELLLEDSTDVTEKNDGILVDHGDDDMSYIEWAEVDRVEFER